MEDTLAQVLTLSNVVFCLMISVLVFVIRRGVNAFWKSAKQNKIWNELILPILPLVTGGCLAASISAWPYPEDFQTFGARVIFGCVAGLFSAHTYRVVHNMIKKREEEKGVEKSSENLDGPL